MRQPAPACVHDYRVIDTHVDLIIGEEKNPVFQLECRKCRSRRQAAGQAELNVLMAHRPNERSAG